MVPSPTLHPSRSGRVCCRVAHHVLGVHALLVVHTGQVLGWRPVATVVVVQGFPPVVVRLGIRRLPPVHVRVRLWGGGGFGGRGGGRGWGVLLPPHHHVLVAAVVWPQVVCWPGDVYCTLPTTVAHNLLLWGEEWEVSGSGSVTSPDIDTTWERGLLGVKLSSMSRLNLKGQGIEYAQLRVKDQVIYFFSLTHLQKFSMLDSVLKVKLSVSSPGLLYKCPQYCTQH